MSPTPSSAAPRQPADSTPPASDCCTPSGRVRPQALRGFAELFKALGDATRLQILGLLAAQTRPLCACELETHFDLSQPTMSHHLRILRQAGLLTGERRGTWIYFAIVPAACARLAEFAELLRGGRATAGQPARTGTRAARRRAPRARLASFRPIPDRRDAARNESNSR
jgi:ArsR family transcriptional regulator